MTAFTVPDPSGVVAERFRDADDRVLVSAFTFGGRRLSGALSKTEAEVSVLVEGSPPGGFDAATERALGSLTREDAEVYVADGEGRYRFLHAKYAVVNDSAVVTTENWGDRNFGPEASGSRGRGVVVRDERVSDYLAEVFREDVDWRGVSAWGNATVEAEDEGSEDGGDGGVASGFAATETRGAEVKVFVAPDRGVEPIVSLIRGADEYVYVQQSYIRSWNGDLGSNPYVAALRERARDGVEVRVLLDGRWYYEEENARVAERLNSSEGIEARLSEIPTHTKGVVVDGEEVLVSSVNWNENSPTDNREVGVVVDDVEVAGYFERVFLHDWRAEAPSGGGAGEGGIPTPDEYPLEVAVIAVVSCIGVWLVKKEI